MQKYSTKVEIIVGNPYAHIPKDILETIFKEFGKDKGQIPVRGKLNGAPFKQTLVRYSGDWRLYLNGIMLKDAGFKFKVGEIRSVVGEKVEIELEYDPESRELPMNPKLKEALGKNPKAKKAYEELAPYRKHEINRYLVFLKTEESLDKNIARVLQHLKGEKSDGLYALMHRKVGE